MPFIEFENLTTSAEACSRDVACEGVLVNIDIVPVDSASFDITIFRVLPDGTLSTIYSAAGVNAVQALGAADFSPSPLRLVGPVRVVLANAGNHADAAHVYLTVA
jgi:hypothetical protein